MAVIDLKVPAIDGAAERLAQRRERIGVVEIDHGGAVTQRTGQIDAELLEDVALDLGDGHLEHDLVAAANDKRVDDPLCRPGGDGSKGRHGLDQARRHIVSLLRLQLARHGAGQNHGIADALDRDVVVRQHVLERRADAVEIAHHGDVEAGDLLALGVKDKNAGLALLDADDVGAARGAYDHIGNRGIGDQNIFDVARQVDDKGLADAERHGVR